MKSVEPFEYKSESFQRRYNHYVCPRPVIINGPVKA